MIKLSLYAWVVLAIGEAFPPAHASPRSPTIQFHDFLDQYLRRSPVSALSQAQTQEAQQALASSMTPYANRLTLSGQWFENRDLQINQVSGKGESYALKLAQDLPTGTQLSLEKNYTNYREYIYGRGNGDSWSFGLTQDLLKNYFGYSALNFYQQVDLQAEKSVLQNQLALSTDCQKAAELYLSNWFLQQQFLLAKKTSEFALSVQQTYHQLLKRRLLPERNWPAIQLDTLARQRETSELQQQWEEQRRSANTLDIELKSDQLLETPLFLFELKLPALPDASLSAQIEQKNQAMALKEYQVANNQNLPDLEFFLNYQENEDDYVSSQIKEDEKQVGLRLIITPLESWQKYEIQEKHWKATAAELQWRESNRQDLLEMNNLQEKISLLAAQEKTLEQEVSLAKAHMNSNYQLFKEGRLDLTDYQNARDQLAQSELTQLKNKYQYFVSVIQYDSLANAAQSYCQKSEEKLP